MEPYLILYLSIRLTTSTIHYLRVNLAALLFQFLFPGPTFRPQLGEGVVVGDNIDRHITRQD